jgi:hypothetical protein
VIAVACAAASACYSPTLKPCSVHCPNMEPCPGDLHCGPDSFCHAAGENMDCSQTPFSVMVSLTGDGNGVVTANGTSCNLPSCQVPVMQNASVTLTATATSTPNISNFATWGMDCSTFGATPTCTLTATTNLNVSADFHRAATLSVNLNFSGASGTVTFDSGLAPCTDNPCERFPDFNSQVMISGTTSGQLFFDSTNNCSMQPSFCDVMMSGTVLVTATFTP